MLATAPASILPGPGSAFAPDAPLAGGGPLRSRSLRCCRGRHARGADGGRGAHGAGPTALADDGARLSPLACAGQRRRTPRPRRCRRASPFCACASTPCSRNSTSSPTRWCSAPSTTTACGSPAWMSWAARLRCASRRIFRAAAGDLLPRSRARCGDPAGAHAAAGGGENPVAIVRVPRERMVGNGIASSLVHEVGHQARRCSIWWTSLRRYCRRCKAEGRCGARWRGRYSSAASLKFSRTLAVAKVGVSRPPA